MQKKLVLYHHFPEEMPQREMADQFNELFGFAEMLGDNLVAGVYGDVGSPQDQLRSALSQCREADAYLLTYDIHSLCPKRGEAMQLIDDLQQEMLFVMFVDDESVMETIAPELKVSG